MIKLKAEHSSEREERLVVLFRRLLNHRDETDKLIRAVASLGTYHVGTLPGGEAFIVCFACGMASFHPTDIEKKYCGMCRDFHEVAL